MALRRKHRTPQTGYDVTFHEHTHGFILKHDEVLARHGKTLDDLSAEIERMNRAIEHLADKVSKCITAVASSGQPKRPAAPAKKNNQVYTTDEIALATMLRDQGTTYATIAAVLNRTEASVVQLFRRLRANDPRVGQPRKKKTAEAK